MATIPQSLEDIMASSGVDPGLSSNLVQEGWTVESFGLAAPDIHEFDTVLTELFSGNSLSLLQKAQLRVAFKKCQQVSNPAPASSSGEVRKEPSTPNSWSESFAPKLDNQAIH